MRFGKKKAPDPAACASSPEEIDPSNMMPPANQERSQYQSGELSKERVESNIPRGADAEGNWVYPSEQMFFNALHRKGKGEGVQEEAMPAVVAIHNNMNENTWREVLKWEALRKHECDAPKLLRFMGKHFRLTKYAPQQNNFVLYDAFWASEPHPQPGKSASQYDTISMRPLTARGAHPPRRALAHGNSKYGRPAAS